MGAVLTQGLREYLDYRQRQRELKGLLRLLDVETYRHRIQLNAFRENSEWITEAPEHRIRFAEWDVSKDRFAILLKDDTQFADIAKYYENLRVINDFRLSSTDSERWRQERVTKQLPALLELHDLTRTPRPYKAAHKKLRVGLREWDTARVTAT